VFAERYEEDIEEWYYNLQEQEDLMKYLCADRYLKDKDQSMTFSHYCTLAHTSWPSSTSRATSASHALYYTSCCISKVCLYREISETSSYVVWHHLVD